jgi:hypothetical protein
MAGDVDLAGGADGVERDRISAIEAQHTQTLEWNRLAQQHGDARERHVERGRLGYQACERGEERVDHERRPV